MRGGRGCGRWMSGGGRMARRREAAPLSVGDVDVLGNVARLACDWMHGSRMGGQRHPAADRIPWRGDLTSRDLDPVVVLKLVERIAPEGVAWAWDRATKVGRRPERDEAKRLLAARGRHDSRSSVRSGTSS